MSRMCQTNLICLKVFNNLHEALSKKHSSTAEYISSSYKAVVGLIKDALQGSLNRANRIIFLKMMQYHVEEKLCKTIEAASPDVICDSKLPAGELVDIASDLDEWFSKEFRMPEEMGTIPGSLRKIASCIAGDSPAPVFEQVHDGIPRETASVQSLRPQRKSQQSRFANSSNQRFSHLSGSPPHSGKETVADPASKLLQDLNGILGIGGEKKSSSRHANRSRRAGNPAHGSSSNFPPRHPLSLLNRNSFGSSGGAHSPRIVPNHNEHSALGRVNGPRVDTPVHRQPPRGPRLQSFPAPSANNSHAQARQKNATHRRNVNSSQPRAHVLPD
ncbi:hypothetical protein SLS60_002461 [Paraconiothyrium brasiliense]|uniref:Uncharacterized protein n=1 Tax=Paraconiothyrium brasiliense TaxID=300254 RepID=A0ABR3S285_9PLEO